MTITVEATFENGTFKIADHIGLPEGARVQLTITKLDADPLADVIGGVAGVGAESSERSPQRALQPRRRSGWTSSRCPQVWFRSTGRGTLSPPSSSE